MTDDQLTDQTPPRPAIKLDRAILCAEPDCDTVWQMNGAQTCPCCGSSQGIVLAAALRGRATKP